MLGCGLERETKRVGGKIKKKKKISSTPSLHQHNNTTKPERPELLQSSAKKTLIWRQLELSLSLASPPAPIPTPTRHSILSISIARRFPATTTTTTTSSAGRRDGAFSPPHIPQPSVASAAAAESPTTTSFRRGSQTLTVDFG